MDITPIYELRTRLKTAAIAGTNLLSEDFRLKRAVEAMQPLTAVSPVFARIVQLAQKLLSPEEADKEGTLLDAITLADAVLCTQGAVAAGDVEPLKTGSFGSVVTNAPYSVVKTLIDALTSSGNGHYSYVQETHEKQPELFKDYRIRAAMVQALGASYSELADTVAGWLKQEGEAVIPLLKSGFDPKGRKEMVRRVQVMEAAAGAKANAFYLEQLPEAEKEVRQSLIYALRHCPENAELLLNMTKTEKGNAKKTVYYALACLEDERVSECFRNMMEKKPEDVLTYIEASETAWASDIVAEGLKEQLLPWAEHRILTDNKSLSKEQAYMLGLYLKALPFKNGAGIRECYRLAAAVGSRLDKPLEGEKTVWMPGGFTAAGTLIRLPFQKIIPVRLREAMLIHPDKELFKLAYELYEKGKGSEAEAEYFSAAMKAKLLSEEDCCGWIREQLYERTLTGKKRKAAAVTCLEEGILGLHWDDYKKTYVLDTGLRSAADGQYCSYIQPLKQKVQGEFSGLLMEFGGKSIDNVLSRCFCPEDREYNDRLLDYFYKRALTNSENRYYCTILRLNGGMKCEGLAVHYFKSRGKVSMWEFMSYITQMPGDGAAKETEARRVIDMVKSGKLKGQDINYDRLEQYIQELKFI